MSEENQDMVQEQHVVYNISDMIIRYGVSQMEIMQYFMHAGLPYHKKNDSYEFYESEIELWETSVKCISWDAAQFDTKYYDLEDKKFLARSDYAEKMDLDSGRRDRYLELKRRAEEIEAKKAVEAEKKERRLNAIRLFIVGIIVASLIVMKLDILPNGLIHSAPVCIAVLAAMVLLFTFPAFRMLSAFGLVFAVVAGILFLIHVSQVNSGFIEPKTVVESTGGADTINTLGE